MLAGTSASRCATLWWWLSTGRAGMRRRLKISTAALTGRYRFTELMSG